ncbi:MAG TPA: phage tail sheath C-terminal domain-containing protein [Solirubrobacteraceae bacterium]|nr:phage tail sheath C-terminal domain-containing protein [Solirubrobacteraceae bacterium]
MTIPYTPGVVVHEIPAQNKPIEGVATSVVGFVGRTPGGPVNTPIQVTNWTQFVKTFSDPADVVRPHGQKRGPYIPGAYLAHAVYGFFQNGGGVCWVVRVEEYDDSDIPEVRLLPAGSTAGADVPDVFRAFAKPEVKGDVTIAVAEDPPPDPAASPATGTALTVLPTTPVSTQPTITVTVTGPDPFEDETHANLTVLPGPRYLPTVLNSASKMVRVSETGALIPATPRSVAPVAETKLAKPEQAKLVVNELVGDPATRTGVYALEAAHGLTTVCVPDAMSVEDDQGVVGTAESIQAVQGAVSSFCEANQAMAIFDAPIDRDTPQEIKEWVASPQAPPPSKFGTLYWPWIMVNDPLGGDPVAVPPCGHVAGVWARTDETRGVFKAPANEDLRGALALGYATNDVEQSDMNQAGINCIRFFPGRGIRIWGARTLSVNTDPEWKYLNVRRLFNYLSASILNGTQWAVFEPNDETLWVSLQVSVSNFLTTVWRTGALFGTSPSEAFFVKCDAETNPPEERDLGKVNIVVGVAPVKPAEFVIFQLSQYQPAG